MPQRLGVAVVGFALLVVAAHVAQAAWLAAHGGDVSYRKAAEAIVAPLGIAVVGLGLARARRRVVLAGTLVLALVALADLLYAWVFIKSVVGLAAADDRGGFVVANVQGVAVPLALVVAARWAKRPDRRLASVLAFLFVEMAAAALVAPFVFLPHSDTMTIPVRVVAPLATAAALALAGAGILQARGG